MKRILIIDPYLDTMGGGEEHILSMAKVFDEHGYEVVLSWTDTNIEKRIKERFGFVFKNLSFITNFNKLSVVGRYKVTGQFDYLIYATDGSYFFSKARHNYIFSMYPKREIYNMSLVNKVKLHNFDFIANSLFTRKYLSKWILKPISVITPHLQADFFAPIPKKKMKTIVSVGRFFEHLHSKRHDILVEAFKKLHKIDSGWSLTLIGGLRDEDRSYFDKILSMAKGYKNINLLPNATHQLLMDKLNESQFYWHAAGWGVDEQKNLEVVEHFGIAPLQGLSRGCVVCAYNAGGQKDLIESGKNGFLYNNIDQLVDLTLRVSKSQTLAKEIQENAVITASQYSYEHFKNNCLSLFNI